MIDDRKARRKSPGFPSLSLPKAIQLVSRVYSGAFDSTIDTHTVLELMGFRGVSGASRTALSSLKQFGLIEGRDTDNRVTKLAAQILHPVAEIERLSAIVEASKKPAIFGEIFSQFKGSLPDEKVIKSFLIRNHGFSDVGADSLVKCLKETEDYVSPIRRNYKDMISASNGLSDNPESDISSEKQSFEAVGRNDEIIIKASKVIKVPIAPNCHAVVSLEGEVNQKAIDKLIAFLNLAKDSFPL